MAILKIRNIFFNFFNYFFKTVKSVLSLIICANFIAGCHFISGNISASGLVIDERSIILINKGSSITHVVKTLGKPSFTSLTEKTNDPQTFYYVSQKKETLLPLDVFKNKVTKRTIIKISFGKNERVSDVKKIIIEDTKESNFIPSPRPTQVPISKHIGFFSKVSNSK